MSDEMKKAARDWSQVENGQAKPEAIELWDAINQVVAASGGSTSCTSGARRRAVVRVDRAVTAIVAAALAGIEAATAEQPSARSAEADDEWLRGYMDQTKSFAAMLERLNIRLVPSTAEQPAAAEVADRTDRDLMALARHPGSNLYHVKDNDRPMFVLADSWGEAVATYEAMVRRENDLEPDEEVEILGVDFVANRRDILVAPIDVEEAR